VYLWTHIFIFLSVSLQILHIWLTILKIYFWVMRLTFFR